MFVSFFPEIISITIVITSNINEELNSFWTLGLHPHMISLLNQNKGLCCSAESFAIKSIFFTSASLTGQKPTSFGCSEACVTDACHFKAFCQETPSIYSKMASAPCVPGCSRDGGRGRGDWLLTASEPTGCTAWGTARCCDARLLLGAMKDYKAKDFRCLQCTTYTNANYTGTF